MAETRSTRSSLMMGGACAAAGILSAMGVFDSISGFPVIFAGVCLLFGLLSLSGVQPRQTAQIPAMVLLAGATIAVGGWRARAMAIEERLTDRRIEVLSTLQGRAVPSLEDLEPLNTTLTSWNEAASLTAEATLVTFWARWCSPCWKEMEELEVLYREHKNRGLRVVAVTRFDTPEDEAARESDIAKAKNFLDDRELTYPAAITDRIDIYRAYRVPTPPGLALIDREGRVVDYAIALSDARAVMRKAVDLINATTSG